VLFFWRMAMRIRLLVLLALSGSLLPFCPERAQSLRAARADEDVFGHEALCVTIWPEKAQVKAGEKFALHFRVANSSDCTQSFVVMGCSYCEDWRSSNPRMAIVCPICRGNVPGRIDLKPGEAYEKPLVMRVTADGPRKTEAFRMGFQPRRPSADSEDEGILEHRIYWSNEVVVGLK
jgi:hypothetical protein